jgi:arylsulfatase A-like enzyme
VFLHVIDPHMPYAPPKPFDTRFAKRGVDDLPNWPPDLDTMRRTPPSDEIKQACVDLYDGEIAFVDAQIERLLASLRDAGTLDDTLVVLHSDHGEEFWSTAAATTATRSTTSSCACRSRWCGPVTSRRSA